MTKPGPGARYATVCYQMHRREKSFSNNLIILRLWKSLFKNQVLHTRAIHVCYAISDYQLLPGIPNRELHKGWNNLFSHRCTWRASDSILHLSNVQLIRAKWTNRHFSSSYIPSSGNSHTVFSRVRRLVQIANKTLRMKIRRQLLRYSYPLWLSSHWCECNGMLFLN